jgi:sec-independent protein translocase protein TatB
MRHIVRAMFGLSTWEVLIILVMALVFIGPDQLPRVARKLGEGMRQVRGAMTRVDAEVRSAIREATAEDALAEEAEAERMRAEAARAATPLREHDAPPPSTPPAGITAAMTHNADPDEPVLEAESGGGVTLRPAATATASASGPPTAAAPGLPSQASGRAAPAYAVAQKPRRVAAEVKPAAPEVSDGTVHHPEDPT